MVRELGALSKEPKVLALGGGAVLAGDVRDALRLVEHVVWLTAPAGELWRRVSADEGDERPLARDEQAFAALLAAREAAVSRSGHAGGRHVGPRCRADRLGARGGAVGLGSPRRGRTGDPDARGGCRVRRLTVRAESRTYPILVGRDLLPSAGRRGEAAPRQGPGRRAVRRERRSALPGARRAAVCARPACAPPT